MRRIFDRAGRELTHILDSVLALPIAVLRIVLGLAIFLVLLPFSVFLVALCDRDFDRTTDWMLDRIGVAVNGKFKE